jgi:hypothetical protein
MPQKGCKKPGVAEANRRRTGWHHRDEAREAIRKSKFELWADTEFRQRVCSSMSDNHSDFNGQNNPRFGDHRTYEEIYGLEKTFTLKERRRLICLEKYGVDNFSKTEMFRKSQQEYMLNGGAAYANSFIKNPSWPQIKVFNIVKESYEDAILNYPCLNYSIDIAIPSLMIAIEYDGNYWHPDKGYDERRQREIEQHGWRFIRYRNHVPKRENLLKDIQQCRLLLLKDLVQTPDLWSKDLDRVL